MTENEEEYITKTIITMNKNLLLSIVAILSTSAGFAQQERQPAFPGAEGWGMYTTGGRAIDERGSVVYHVTSLDDCSDNNLVEGTLRWALHTGDDTPRTILFDVCGTIKLTSKLKFKYPNVSILGQSAPGGGICISGANIYVCKSNVILRHIRFRAGDEADKNYAALDVENVENVIIDHCTFSWSMEENVTMYDNDYTTMQWCILSEPLYYSRHKKGERGYGSQWGGEHSSFHHNLFAHCVSRGPRLNGARDRNTNYGAHDQYVDTEVVNNVMYNWGKKECTHGGEYDAPDTLYTIKTITNEDGSKTKDTLEIHTGTYVNNNLVNNYYKPGPATDACAGGNRWFARISRIDGGLGKYSKWYVNGNIMEENNYHYSNANQTSEDKFKGNYEEINNNNWYNANTTSSKKALDIQYGASDENMQKHYLDNDKTMSKLITIESAEDAYANVIKNAGCTLPRRDEVDVRILAEAAGKREPIYHGSFKATYLGVIDSQNDLKPANADENWSAWPSLAMEEGETLPVDTDRDGIPDEYEIANGLDHTSAADGGAIAENGYSNLENYLETIVAKPDPILENTPINNIKVENLSIVKDANGTINIGADKTIVAVMVYDVNGRLIENAVVHATSTSIKSTNNNMQIVKLIFNDGSSVAHKL